MRRGVRRLWSERDGSVLLEFAIVSSALVMILFFIVGLGLTLWAKAALQAAASQTARCLAIQSPLCANPQNYASSLVNDWGAAGITGTLSVTPQLNTTCNNAVGRFSAVTVTGTQNLVQSISPSLSGVVLSATSCYPSAI